MNEHIYVVWLHIFNAWVYIQELKYNMYIWGFSQYRYSLSVYGTPMIYYIQLDCQNFGMFINSLVTKKKLS